MPLNLKETKALANKLAELCPIHDKGAFDKIWHPLVKAVSYQIVRSCYSDAFEASCVRGIWRDDLVRKRGI